MNIREHFFKLVIHHFTCIDSPSSLSLPYERHLEDQYFAREPGGRGRGAASIQQTEHFPLSLSRAIRLESRDDGLTIPPILWVDCSVLPLPTRPHYMLNEQKSSSLAGRFVVSTSSRFLPVTKHLWENAKRQ